VLGLAMPLLTFWKSAPESVEQLTIEQVVSSAGDGALKDNSICSKELREYLAQIPSIKIAKYVEHCLSVSFSKSGMVLQDLVNELGRRLEYQVSNGIYQGTVKATGFDGLWISPEGHTIIVEVKTTDAYRISLETIVGYRNKLSNNGQLAGPVSFLIVVGREDTGELEAQVRGSRHAWDIRLISADALIKLVQLKENTEDTETGLKIRSLLAPMEYTRLDKMIDVMFTAAKDLEGAALIADSDSHSDSDELSSAQTTLEKEKGVWQFTDSGLLQDKRDKIVSALSLHIGVSFIKKSRAMFWDASHNIRLICTISKRYKKTSSQLYWYAFHPQWNVFLSEGKDAFLVLGCMDLPFAFAVPLHVIAKALDGLNTTTREDGQLYWHIQVVEPKSDKYAMLLPKKSEALALDAYRLTIG
jgi:hypothetical protein